MLKTIDYSQCASLPHLNSASITQRHNGKINFSLAKPNVILGPNGSGKSTLLSLIALRFLCFFTSYSSFDPKYVRSYDSDGYWLLSNPDRSWMKDFEFLRGLKVTTDNAPALFYRPGHIPGGEKCYTTAMMTGYFEEAKALAMKTKHKSHGQVAQTLLEDVKAALAGQSLPTSIVDLPTPVQLDPYNSSTQKLKANILASLLAVDDAQYPRCKPLILMDEPEQSLDLRAEIDLWKQIENNDPERAQVIVATHSLYPLLHSKRFNIIEAAPGYLAEARALIS